MNYKKALLLRSLMSDIQPIVDLVESRDLKMLLENDYVLTTHYEENEFSRLATTKIRRVIRIAL